MKANSGMGKTMQGRLVKEKDNNDKSTKMSGFVPWKGNVWTTNSGLE